MRFKPQPTEEDVAAAASAAPKDRAAHGAATTGKTSDAGEEKNEALIPSEPRSGESETELSSEQKKSLALSERGAANRFTPQNLLLALVVVSGSYFLWRSFDAEQKFRQALAAAPTDGVATYNLLQDAIRQNPYHVGYRLTYSQVNFALANVFAGQEASPSAETRATIQQLIGQAVREARVAVGLSPNDAGSWQNLASFYRALIGVGEGAEQWAVGTYQQAVGLAPFDPRLHLDLGGVYFLTGNFTAALDEFTLSGQLKPDWANAHYNRAQALKSLGRKDEAGKALNEVLRRLPAGSTDREVVEKELAQIEVVEESVTRVRPPTGEEVNPPYEASPSAENVPPPIEVPAPPPEATAPAAPYGPGPIEVIP